MNFFESQDTAKRSTGKLVLLFVLAVLSLILLTNLLVIFAFGLFSAENEAVSFAIDWEIFLAISAAVGSIVLFGSLYKIQSLRGGGARVAEMMNGRLLMPDSGDFLERRTLNVVEEMAIASGTPVPPVYVMEESGINAFAAGYSPSDAVIGITRGAMETLSREQLQGVIAHEFSHILHGDMRINIRLIGVLHGILILGIIGYYILRSGARSRRSKDGAGVAVLGLGLIVIGYTGTFFGKLIKAAVSRQREYLADASAVQFTRNPDGIGGALMQIGHHSSHSYLEHPGSQEISHALFEEAGKSSFRSLYATHPPLEKRILAILPNWDGDYEAALIVQERQAREETPESEKQARTPQDILLTSVLAGGAVASIGQPVSSHLGAAEAILQSIPEPVLAAARQPSAARALIYLLVLDAEPESRQSQLEQLVHSADAGVYTELESLLKLDWQLSQSQRLPLAEIALPALRQLSVKQYELFKENFEALIAQDKTIKLFEWCVQKFLFHHLEEVFSGSRNRRLGRKDLTDCIGSIATLLGVISCSHKSRVMSSETVFERGVSELSLSLQLPAMEDITYAALDKALLELRGVKPLQKPALLKACAASIMADEEVTALEADLLRTVAAILDCPMPPLTQTS